MVWYRTEPGGWASRGLSGGGQLEFWSVRCRIAAPAGGCVSVFFPFPSGLGPCAALCDASSLCVRVCPLRIVHVVCLWASVAVGRAVASRRSAAPAGGCCCFVSWVSGTFNLYTPYRCIAYYQLCSVLRGGETGSQSWCARSPGMSRQACVVDYSFLFIIWINGGHRE